MSASSEFFVSITSIATALVGVAIIGELVSRNSQTSTVISSATGGFAQDLAAAQASVTGGTSSFSSGGLSISGLSAEYN